MKSLIAFFFVVLIGCGGGGATPQPAPVPPGPDLRLIVVIGDSLAADHPIFLSRLEAENLALLNAPGQVSYAIEQDTGLPTLNNAMGSMYVADIVARWGRDVLHDGSAPAGFWPGATPTLPRPATHVWLHLGINDVINRRDPELARQGLETLVTSARTNRVHLYLDTIPLPRYPNIYEPSWGWTIPIIDTLNTWIKAQEGPYVRVMDFNAFFIDPADPTKNNTALFGPDGMHPNAEGYTRWGHAIAARMKQDL